MEVTMVPSDHSADNGVANGEYVVRLAPLDCSAKSRTDNIKLCRRALVSHRHSCRKAEVPAQNLPGCHPYPSGQFYSHRSINITDDLATRRKTTAATEASGVYINVILEIDSRRRKRAGGRAA